MKRRFVINSEIAWMADHEDELDDKLDEIIMKFRVDGFPVSHPLALEWKTRKAKKAAATPLTVADIWEAYGFNPNE